MMTEDYLMWLIRRLPTGLTEIYFHPSSDPDSEAVERPTATHHTVTELQALLSPRVRRALAEENVLLLSEGSGAARVDAERT